MRLNPIDTVRVGTADGQTIANVYAARIVFPSENWALDLGRVAGVNLTGQALDLVGSSPPVIALLGRNFLAQGIFIYNGTAGMWSFSM